jgi:hypothetical protein
MMLYPAMTGLNVFFFENKMEGVGTLSPGAQTHTVEDLQTVVAT